MFFITAELFRMLSITQRSHKKTSSIWVIKAYNLYREFKDGKPVLDMRKLKLSKVNPIDQNDSVITDLKPNVSKRVYKNDEISVYTSSMAKIKKMYNVKQYSKPKKKPEFELITVLNVASTLNRCKSDIPIITYSLSDLYYSERLNSDEEVSVWTFWFSKTRNFLHLIKLSLYMLMIIGLQFLPNPTFSIMLLIEFVLMFYTWGLYCQYQHLRASYICFHTVVQHLNFIVIFTCLLFISVENKEFNYSVHSGVQT